MTAAKKLIRAKSDASIQITAARIIRDVKLDDNSMKLLCAIFLWCEGQTDITNGVRFVNSDPAMIKVFLRLLREAFELNESKFRALIHLHDYHDPDTQLMFWSKITKIKPSQFHKPYKKPHTGRNKRLGYQGCISIRYQDRSLGKLLQEVYTEFAEGL